MQFIPRSSNQKLLSNILFFLYHVRTRVIQPTTAKNPYHSCLCYTHQYVLLLTRYETLMSLIGYCIMANQSYKTPTKLPK